MSLSGSRVGCRQERGFRSIRALRGQENPLSVFKGVIGEFPVESCEL